MATQAPYCTAQDVVDCCVWPQFEQLSGSAQTRLIATASEKIDEHCRRPYGFAAQSIAESLDGRNRPTVWLSLRPVLAVSGVTVNGTALDNTYGTAWCFDPGTGKLARGQNLDDTRFAPWFPAGTGNVVVQYWGGYQDLPNRLVTATAMMVRYLWEQGKRSGLYQSESIGDYSFTLREQPMRGGVPAHVADELQGFVQDDAF